MAEIRISLRAARVNAGLTQEEAARKLHHTKQTICSWETGTSVIRYADLIALTDLYGIPMENLRLQ